MNIRLVKELPTMKAKELPRPTSWEVRCPSCERLIPYEPGEDDAGAFTPVEDWPICEPCEILIEPATVAIRDAEAPYFVERL